MLNLDHRFEDGQVDNLNKRYWFHGGVAGSSLGVDLLNLLDDLIETRRGEVLSFFGDRVNNRGHRSDLRNRFLQSANAHGNTTSCIVTANRGCSEALRKRFHHGRDALSLGGHCRTDSLDHQVLALWEEYSGCSCNDFGLVRS